MDVKQKETTKGAGRGLILVVEDDTFLKNLLVQRLKQEGFGTQEALDGKTALELLKNTAPTLIILDLLMPGTDGFQVLEEIRKDSRQKGVPVIVLSNMGEQEHIERAKTLGADEYLVKAHFTLGEIVEKINKLIAKRYI